MDYRMHSFFSLGLCALFHPLTSARAHTGLPVVPDDRAPRRHTHSILLHYTKQLLGYIERTNKSCPLAVVSRIQEFYGPKKRRPDIQ